MINSDTHPLPNITLTKLKFNGYSEMNVETPRTVSLGGLITHGDNNCGLSITFKTPTRIKSGNHLTKELDFHVLLQNVLNRIPLLSHVCGDTS